MSQIICTDEFIKDFELLYTFLADNNQLAAQRLATLLQEKLDILAYIPKAFTYLGEFRLYLLEFGAYGYAILYDFKEDEDVIIFLRMKHQKEVGF